MGVRRLAFVSVLAGSVFAACVGDDPETVAPGPSNDGGPNTPTDTSPSTPDTGTDANGATDADAGPPTPVGTARWLKPINGPAGSLAAGIRSAIDGQGNVVVIGYLFGTGTFDFGDTKTLTASAANDIEGFIAKYDGNGVCQWAKLVSGTGDDLLINLAVGPNGEVVAVGESNSPVVTVASTPTNEPADSGTSRDILVVKLDAAGNLAWHRMYGGAGWDSAESVAIASNGDIALGGRIVTNASAVKFDTVSVIEQASTDQIGAVVLLDKDGKGKWGRGFPKIASGSSGAIITASTLAFDALGDVIVGGWFTTSVTVKANPPIQFTTRGGDDGWLAKLQRADGTSTWGLQLGGAAGDRVKGVVVDSTSQIYVAGQYTGPGAVMIASNNLPIFGGVDVFVAKVDPSSVVQWARGFGTPMKDEIEGILLDPWGNIVIGGGQSQTIDWNGVPSTSAGNDDGYIVKMSNDGMKTFWAYGLGSGAQDLGFGGIGVSSTGATSIVGGLKGAAILAGKSFTLADASTMGGYVLMLEH